MGILIGIATALSSSIQNAANRRLADLPTSFLNWFRFLAAAIGLAIFVTVSGAWELPPLNFWILTLAISVPLETLLAFCYIRAFQRSPQSLVGPLFSLSVIFLVPVSFLLLGEVPSRLGLLGVASGVVGALALGWDIGHPGIRNSLRNIFRQPGSYYMLGAAAIASFVVPVAKLTFGYASPLLAAFFIVFGLLIVHTPFALRHSLGVIRGHSASLAAMGAAYALTTAFHYLGLSLILAAYFISIKRLSVVFDVVLGRFFQGEDHFGTRLLGALLMVAGVILIALG